MTKVRGSGQATRPVVTRSVEPMSAQWLAHEKHFFVQSSAGKPIYSRYGDESKLSNLMGIFQALVSFYQDGHDSLR
jgi:hypothetical protein